MEDDQNISKTEAICRVCLKTVSKYICPRCHLQYCSVTCYRSPHHENCSESFYRDCVMEGLKDYGSSKEDKLKVRDMLQRLNTDQLGDGEDHGKNSVHTQRLNTDQLGDGEDHESEDNEDEAEEFPSLADRIQGLDLDKDTEKIWEKLTQWEKQEFEEMAKDGRLLNLVEQWDPWWNIKESDLIEEDRISLRPALPKIAENIPQMTSLLPKGKVSECVKYSLVDILFSYAYVARLHNGDLEVSTQDCAQEILSLSPSLNESQNYPNAVEALHGCLQCLQERANDLFVSQSYSIGIVEDVQKILVGPSRFRAQAYVMAALSHVLQLLQLGGKAVNRDKKKLFKADPQLEELKQLRHKLFQAEKKVEFLLSWCLAFGSCVQELVAPLSLEQANLAVEDETHNVCKSHLEKHWGGSQPPWNKKKKLIEELS